jgi:hypothetical protein
MIKNNKVNYIKKLFRKIKENFMSDDIKEEIKVELIDPMFIEMKKLILPHYVIFLVLFIVIIILISYLIMLTQNLNFYHINK